ncbi:hypothetical protein SMJ63A_10122 [Stenotrophomonas geniculata]
MRVGVPRQTNSHREEGLADLSIPTHRPPLKAIGAFSLLRRKSQRWVFIRLFETPIPAQAICLGAVIMGSRNHGGL